MPYQQQAHVLCVACSVVYTQRRSFRYVCAHRQTTRKESESESEKEKESRPLYTERAHRVHTRAINNAQSSRQHNTAQLHLMIIIAINRCADAYLRLACADIRTSTSCWLDCCGHYTTSNVRNNFRCNLHKYSRTPRWKWNGKHFIWKLHLWTMSIAWKFLELLMNIDYSIHTLGTISSDIVEFLAMPCVTMAKYIQVCWLIQSELVRASLIME